MALGSREKQEAADLVARPSSHGYMPVKLANNSDILSGYIAVAGRAIEVMSIPSKYNRLFGLAPAQYFFR